MAGGKKMKMDKDPKNNPPVAQPSSSSSTKLADQLKSDLLLLEVFSNDIIRDKILEHVIYPSPSPTSNDPQINYRDIPNLRLVQKNWLLSTSRILRQHRHPLFHLHNQDEFPLFVASAEHQKKEMYKFIRTMTRPRRLDPLVAPFKLSLICSFFVPENHKILSDLFEKCGPGLVSLNAVIPKTCAMSFVFPSFSLEILQRLTIEFTAHSHNDPDDQISPSHLENLPVTYFIQRLVNSSSELKTVLVRYSSRPNTDGSVIPLGFELISLPPTVSTLLLKGPFSSNHLGVTMPRNQTSHLTTLQFRISQASPVLDENSISRALERHGATLKNLKLCGGKNFLHPRIHYEERPPSLFKIPPMRNLRELCVSSPNWLSVNNFFMTSVNLPNLMKLKLKGISVNLFDNITAVARRSRLKSVKCLEVWLVNQLIGFSITLNEERMQRVHQTFRGVTILEITVCGVDTSGLKYLFREMTTLKSLTITVRKSIGGNDMSSSSFDALLIGEPEWIAKGLKETPDYWQYFEGNAGYDNNPSIMKLTGLSKLTLATKGMLVQNLFSGEMRGRLISEVAFHFALVKMPALKTLQLFGRFQPNQGMLDLWKNAREASGRDVALVYGLDCNEGKRV